MRHFKIVDSKLQTVYNTITNFHLTYNTVEEKIASRRCVHRFFDV